MAPLRSGAFRRLLLARSLNEFGDWLGLIALAAWVFETTGSPLASAGLLLAMQALPALVSPGLIARLELLDTRRMLTGLFAIEAVAFGVIALLVSASLLELVLVVAVIDGTLALALRSLTRSTIAAALIPAGQLRAGNALLNVITTVAAAAGPIAAGVLVATVGTTTALVGDAISFLVCAVVIATGPALPLVEREEGDDEGWRARLAAGIAYVRGTRILAPLIAGQAAAFVFFALTVPVDVVYAIETLDVGESGFGLLLGAWGFGMAAGSAVFTMARRVSLAALAGGSVAVMAAAYIGLALAPTLPLAVIAAAVGGFGCGIQWVSLVTLVQERTEDRYQGRVVGLLESASSGGDALGFILGGALAAAFDPRVAYAVAGLGALAVLAVVASALGRFRGPLLDAKQPA